ncbi:MAG: hypothetical protein H7832_13505 [Magnetococcus sp. DMHC-6]
MSISSREKIVPLKLELFWNRNKPILETNTSHHHTPLMESSLQEQLNHLCPDGESHPITVCKRGWRGSPCSECPHRGFALTIGKGTARPLHPESLKPTLGPFSR